MSYRVIQCVVAWVGLGLCLTMRTMGADAASTNTATLGTNAPVMATATSAPKPAANSPRPSFSADVTNVFRTMTLTPGFRLQLAAADPMITAPVAMAFDSGGRLFVAELVVGSENGQIKMLEDTDGDGVFDQATVFATDVPRPTGLLCYSGGVFVAGPRQILFLSGANGTGATALRREVYGGFEPTNGPVRIGAGLNSLTWGPDNWVHVAAANVTGSLSCLAVPSMPGVPLRGNDFAFNPRTLASRIEPGGESRGLAFDNDGRRFTCSAARPMQFTVCDPARASRNPLFIWPRLTEELPSPDAGLRFQSAAGLLIYRGGSLPTNSINDVFLADPEQRVVLRLHLRTDGLVPGLERPPGKAGCVLLSSRDATFRPVQVIAGPDGSLYVADVAQERLDQTRTAGRIWRISPDSLKPRKIPDFNDYTSAELAPLLASPNGWVRDTAARLLFERNDTNIVRDLAKQLPRAKLPFARQQTLNTLAGLGALTEADVITAMNDPAVVVRERAVQLAEWFVRNDDVSPALWRALDAAANDASVRVQFQAAFTLGRLNRPQVPPRLANIVRNAAPDNRAVQFAVLTSAAYRADQIFMSLVNDQPLRRSDAGWQFLQNLATLTGEESSQGLDDVLIAIERSNLGTTDAFTLARAVGQGLANNGRTFVGAAPRGTWRAFGDRALTLGVDGNNTNLRAEAIRFLGVSGYSSREIGDWLLALMVPGEPPAVQVAAVESLARFPDPLITTAFIQRWPSLSAAAQRAILDRLLGRYDRTLALMTALEQNQIPRGALSDVQVNFLRFHNDSSTAARALRLFGPANGAHLAEQFAKVLPARGTAVHGRALFLARCANCHEFNGEGRAFGPGLEAAADRGRPQLLQDILEPNHEITGGYETQVLQRTDDQLIFGLITKSGEDSYVVRTPSTAPLFLPRTQVEGVYPQKWSLMPEDAAAGLSPADLADLLEYLTAPR